MNEGDEVGKECPKCKIPLVFEVGFMDCFSYVSGHYTRDVPTAVCPNCSYCEDYEIPEPEYEGE